MEMRFFECSWKRCACNDNGRFDVKLKKYLSDRIAIRLDSLRLGLNRWSGRMLFLPTVFLSITSKCNSRCVSCSIWKDPIDELTPSVIEESVAYLKRLGLKNVVITGGEPLLRADLFEILASLSGQGLRLILCTNGMLLRKYREEVLKYFDGMVVSLDSHEASVYKSIRGVDAFDEVVSGIVSMTEGGMRVAIAHTLQKGNILQLAEFIGFAKGLRIDSVSVRPLDAYSVGFGSGHGQPSVRCGLLPSEHDLTEFPQVLGRIERDYSAELTSGFITPDIGGLQKMRDYFQANPDGPFPMTRCFAQHSSCVIESNGDVKPCFFAGAIANVNRVSAGEGRLPMNSPSARKARKGLNSRSDICRKCAYPYIML
jgi:Fe-coproporphyrin III synthase